MDTIGGFSGNHSTKKYIHLLIDHFTRFAFSVTSKNQKANDFINLLNLVLKDGHKIGFLLADQYTGINSVEFKKFLEDNKIKLVLTSVDCPSSNGMNERLNQTLINRLRCKKNENEINKKRPWSTLLADCINEYNNTVHTVTKFSPNYLLNNIKISMTQGIFSKVKSDLYNDREIAFQNSKKAHQVNKKIYDKNKIPGSFEVNDLVYVQHGNCLNRNKLDEIRNGPFKILEKLSNSIYRVDSGFQKKESNIYHISKLYPFCSSFLSNQNESKEVLI